ncbi:ribosome small subunit-dependent GTPase A [Streptomyces sp. DfronAA-171]|nr:ribosome small subunit-dependent GTPase A [Streptomyces sp. DfronAA-171]
MRRYGKNPDEDDVRVRPGRRGSRPRTHTRPKHEDAASGMVLTVDRGRLTCLVDGRRVVAMKARELGRKAAVVGDRVALVGDLSGEKDTLARIVRIEERRSVLRRTADDDDPYERVVVANADQLAIVTALADPEPRPRMIDRCLVAAYDGGLSPLLVLTKSDLASPDRLLERYTPLGVPYVVTSREELYDGEAAGRVRELLDGKVTAFVGHSGVGKTTLVNALVPEDQRRTTGHVNAVTGRGRHTTTSALALPLDGRAAGSSTRRACGPSGSRTSIPRASCSPSPTSCRGPRSARAAARTTSRSARSTPGSPRATRTPSALPRCGGCCPRGSATRGTERAPGVVRPARGKGFAYPKGRQRHKLGRVRTGRTGAGPAAPCRCRRRGARAGPYEREGDTTWRGCWSSWPGCWRRASRSA